MSSSPTTSNLPSSISPSMLDLSHYDPKLRSVLESGSVKFHIRTAGAKWQCTLIDKNTHERRKALRGDSSSSINTVNSSTSSSTGSSRSSH